MVLLAVAVASGFTPGLSFLRSHTEAVLSPLLLTITCSSLGSSCKHAQTLQYPCVFMRSVGLGQGTCLRSPPPCPAQEHTAQKGGLTDSSRHSMQAQKASMPGIPSTGSSIRNP